VIAIVAFSAGGGEGGCPLGGVCPVAKAGCGSGGCNPPAGGPTTKPKGGCGGGCTKAVGADLPVVEAGCGSDGCKPPADSPKKKPGGGCKKECDKVVNTKCPIMGGKVDPDKVPAKLTRTHKDRKVGFCCGGCLPKWDDLSDAEKDAKLKAALES
jgi:hypothetical protein